MNETIIIQNNLWQEPVFPTLLELLLDETLIQGMAYIPRTCFQKVSAPNRHLPAKQQYELILRLAEVFPVCLTDTAPEEPSNYILYPISASVLDKAALQTDCYILARYKKLLLQEHLFDAAINSILQQAQQLRSHDYFITYLENMIKEQDDYKYFYQGSQPFLIYTGYTLCYNILSVFAYALGAALQQMGFLVEYFDLSQEDFTAASRFAGHSYQAIIGMQTYMFSVRLQNNDLLHDKIDGPKFNFLFDHPVWFQQHLMSTPENLTILTLDRNYQTFLQRYYSVKAYFLPPGGIAKPFVEPERFYDVTFIGSYLNNSQDVFVKLRLLDRPMRFLVNRYLLITRKNPHLPAEKALALALEYYGCQLDDDEFLALFRNLRTFVLYITYYYRYLILKKLVDSGIRVDVFGHTWKNCPLRANPNLVWHEADLSTDECLDVWQHSKLALNIMAWHKNAITERIVNSMLQKAVVLTERNPYLEEQFEDNVDIAFYDLAHIDRLPAMVKALLDQPQKRQSIAQSGYEKALAHHTWNCRAKELLECIQNSAEPDK